MPFWGKKKKKDVKQEETKNWPPTEGDAGPLKPSATKAGQAKKDKKIVGTAKTLNVDAEAEKRAKHKAMVEAAKKKKAEAKAKKLAEKLAEEEAEKKIQRKRSS